VGGGGGGEGVFFFFVSGVSGGGGFFFFWLGSAGGGFFWGGGAGGGGGGGAGGRLPFLSSPHKTQHLSPFPLPPRSARKEERPPRTTTVFFSVSYLSDLSLKRKKPGSNGEERERAILGHSEERRGNGKWEDGKKLVFFILSRKRGGPAKTNRTNDVRGVLLPW